MTVRDSRGLSDNPDTQRPPPVALPRAVASGATRRTSKGPSNRRPQEAPSDQWNPQQRDPLRATAREPIETTGWEHIHPEEIMIADTPAVGWNVRSLGGVQ